MTDDLKYKIGDRLEVHNLFAFFNDGEACNGQLVTVKHLPGWHPGLEDGYGVTFKFSGGLVTLPVAERYLRPFPPVLPNGRGDIDKPTSWIEFDTMTGLHSITFRRSNPDW